jgi:hypothetical protein
MFAKLRAEKESADDYQAFEQTNKEKRNLSISIPLSLLI